MMRHYGVCSRLLLETTLEALKSDGRAPLVTPSGRYSEALDAALDEMCINVRDTRYCLKRLNDPKLDPIRVR